MDEIKETKETKETKEIDNIKEINLECKNTMMSLFFKYKDNDYMLQRIKTHITSYLPNTLDNEYRNYVERTNRNTYLTNKQNIFIQVFLSKNKYFYLPNNNFFYEYEGDRYMIVKEDDIIHNLLSSISKERILMNWKHKTKTNIIKQIRERSLFSSIPETDTIQNVLNSIYPSFFTTKNYAKYFLTIIGDNILKKNTHLIFLVTTRMKQFLGEIDNVGLLSIGNSNTTHNFIAKYHENHNYENCRLIKINENFCCNVWREILKKIGLDLLCVAAHYSKRYENSDKFIENNLEEDTKSYTYYLKNTTQENIVDDFCNKYIVSTTDTNLEWKNLHFIWKQFLSSCHLPNVIYSNSLKQLLKDRYTYDEATDTFTGITSKYLPVYRDFILFWENTIDTGMDTNNGSVFFDNEFEVDEMSSLFKVWCKEQTDTLTSNGTISEENIVKILKHFFPSIEIVENKYILNVSSKMWDKTKDIQKSFKCIVQNEDNLAIISFDDAYNCYYTFCNQNSLKNIVSKRYFEKYLYYNFVDHIVYDKFIETRWFIVDENDL